MKGKGFVVELILSYKGIPREVGNLGKSTYFVSTTLARRKFYCLVTLEFRLQAMCAE